MSYDNKYKLLRKFLRGKMRGEKNYFYFIFMFLKHETLFMYDNVLNSLGYDVIWKSDGGR